MKSELGIIGLGVMGKSLSRNLASKGYRMSLYNRHVNGLEENVAKRCIAEFPELGECHGFDQVEEFVESLQTPRKILIMVNAGAAIDSVIDSLEPLLEANDIIIDGGNSHYKETYKRIGTLLQKRILFLGMGVSGGEEGALLGPSLMPGGSKKGYDKVKDYLLAIAAKDDMDRPCCQYIGKDGAGHFVKMVHNGIEYAEMQLIAEVYVVLRFGNNLGPDAIASIFFEWNESSVQNYLLESTANILTKKEGPEYLIDLILDKASHKGTGSWTTIAAAELGSPFTMSSAALNARYISAMKDFRKHMSEIYQIGIDNNGSIGIESLKMAYQASRLINHHQGFEVIKKASDKYGWGIDIRDVAQVWTNGCIIASRLMNDLAASVSVEQSILEMEFASNEMRSGHEHLKSSVLFALQSNIPIPCLAESLNFLNGIQHDFGTGNMIQAQRDYFGAHTYKRINDPDGKDHHTNWKNH